MTRSLPLRCESFSNEIDENDWQYEKQNEQRASIFRGIVIDLIGRHSKEHGPMRLSRSVAARKRTKTENRTMTLSPDANPTIVADPADA
jgi:hypothetical protein